MREQEDVEREAGGREREREEEVKGEERRGLGSTPSDRVEGEAAERERSGRERGLSGEPFPGYPEKRRE